MVASAAIAVNDASIRSDGYDYILVVVTLWDEFIYKPFH
jgi:hypothetical protein